MVYLAGLVQGFGEAFPRLTAVVSGELIAFYQVGYGIAAFGTGWLLGATHVPLSTIYVGGSLVAVVMIVLALLVIRPQTTKAAELKAGTEERKAV
jgi:MFS transporter, FHS family, glucose/mannose:H+ symporter